MPMLDHLAAHHLVAVAFTFCLASFVKGVLGLACLPWRRACSGWSCPYLARLVVATGRCADGTGHRRNRRVRDPGCPYLQALRLEKDTLVQALRLSFTVSTLAIVGSEFAVVPALGGVVQLARSRLSPDRFRRWVFLGLFALGLSMAIETTL